MGAILGKPAPNRRGRESAAGRVFFRSPSTGQAFRDEQVYIYMNEIKDILKEAQSRF